MALCVENVEWNQYWESLHRIYARLEEKMDLNWNKTPKTLVHFLMMEHEMF